MASLEIHVVWLTAGILFFIALVSYLIKLLNSIKQENNELKVKIMLHNQELNDAEKAARKDSTNRQRAILKGQISETLAPWSIDAVNSVKELSFLGNPIDFIGFKGLDTDEEIEIKFIEIKTGNSRLNKSEKRIKEAVLAKRVDWKTIHVSELPEVREI